MSSVKCYTYHLQVNETNLYVDHNMENQKKKRPKQKDGWVSIIKTSL